MNWKNLAFGAVAFAVIAEIAHVVEAMLTMNYYLDPAYFGTWSKIMMPAAGAPPAEFYMYSIVFALVTGALFAYVYSVVRGALPKKNTGIWYGKLVWLVAGFPGSLSMYLMFNMPVGLIAAWTVSSLIIYVAAGWALEKIAG
ncbi:MAG: hypothetical protein V1881_00900 [Candidatus Micrarchaeota archaeon]